jgi:predicted nucleic acid-binding protein
VSAYFFDSSAIVKRYVKEEGSAWVISTSDRASGAHVYLASITGVEVVAALARKRKGSHNAVNCGCGSLAVS